MLFDVVNNCLISVFDVVRLVDPKTRQNYINKIKKAHDYRIILTHGVIGELIIFLENDCYGLDKSKLTICCNNIETTIFFIKNGFNAFTISEYIFFNDSVYNIKSYEKIYDCIFPGRPAKSIGLFKKNYNFKFLDIKDAPGCPVNQNEMVTYYNKSKCGLMTSISEGSCLCIGEMLLCGLPIVSTKIETEIKNKYYPINKKDYSNTYALVLPNTLGGRELWLTKNNSIFCERTDDAIEIAVNNILDKNFDAYKIRDEFLSNLYKERLNFLFLLKNIYDEIDAKLDDLKLSNICNVPYGSSTINSQQWELVKEEFINKYNKVWQK
jgi:hypothetical protein